MWDGKLVVKGVLDAEDAMILKAAGVDAIQVSSHGSRQLDSAPRPILALERSAQRSGQTFRFSMTRGFAVVTML